MATHIGAENPASSPNVEPVLELQVRWGLTVIAVQHHERTPVVTLGDVPGVVHSAATQPLFTCENNQYVLHMAQGFRGFIRAVDGVMETLDDLLPGERIPLDVNESGELVHHNLILAFRFVEPRRKVAAAPLGSLDYGWLNALLSTVFMSAALVATLILYPQDTRGLEDDVPINHNTFQHFVVNPEKKPVPVFLEKLHSTTRAPTSKPSKSDKEKPAKTATREDKRKTDNAAVARSMDSLFSGAASTSVFGSGRSDALLDALGDVRSNEVGDASGFGSLVQRGTGPGTGGNSTGMYEAGRIVTRGIGGGDRTYAPGSGGIGTKTERQIEATGDPIIEGRVDKDLIRRVIRENIAQIKYCYERELTGTPGLHGKVLMKFAIAADGSVATAVVEESSLKNKEAEGCMARKVKSWIFPKPKGSGVVIVTYPFIFKQGG